MIEIIIETYLALAFAFGFSIALFSKRFKRMSFWTQILLLSISPLLVIRAVFTRGR